MSNPEGLTLQNDVVSVRLLPGLGARIVSLQDRRSGREWLLPSQLPGGEYRAARLGDDFSQFDTSGFDECFPAVGAGLSPDGRVQWPDHGELWSRPWEVTEDGEGLLCRIEGVGHPYVFTRRIRLEGDTLCLDYVLENLSHQPFVHLWSAHPLLQVSPGMRIELPQGVDKVFVNGGTPDVLGSFGDWRPWPEVAPGFDLSTVLPREAGVALKCFALEMPEGQAVLRDPEQGDGLAFSWDPRELPHLGLWLCYGGWPSDGRAGHLTVALEPCSGAPDDLAEAFRRGWCPTLPPRSQALWSLRIRLLSSGVAS